MKFAILLTGTIIPNVKVTHSNWEKRRLEYLDAIRYYSKFAPVFFLENSGYNIFDDEEFMKIKNVIYRKFIKSKITDMGIGYQEFEMIDQWVMTENNLPEIWIKVTGRYLVKNFKEIYDKAVNMNNGLIMDIYYWNQLAATRVFCISSKYYKEIFLGSYSYVNGNRGWWIERVLYKSIQKNGFKKITYFDNEPVIEGVSGTVGSKIEVESRTRLCIYSLLRKANKLISKHRLILCFNIKFVVAFYIWKIRCFVNKEY